MKRALFAVFTLAAAAACAVRPTSSCGTTSRVQRFDGTTYKEALFSFAV